MKKVKKVSSHGSYLVVPNSKWKTAKSGFKKAKTSNVVGRAAEATRKTRNYDVVKSNQGTYFVVTSKVNGQLISKFKLDHPKQAKTVRKFSLKPKRGTISPCPASAPVRQI